MRQRWLLNIGLLLLIIGLGFFIWQLPPTMPKTQETPKLTMLDPLQVQNLRVERVGQEPIEIKKVQGVWQIISPLQLPAHDFRIQAILQLLSTRNYRKLDASQVKLAELKLEPAPIKVQFDDLIMEFGDQSPMNEHLRYLKIKSEIYLLSDSVHHFLNGNAVLLANLSPLGTSAKLSELQLPNVHLQLKDGRWSSLKPVENTRDGGADALNTLVETWEHLQALSVRPYHPDPTLPPQGEIQISLQNQPPLNFKIISLTPEFILARPDKSVEYHLSQHQLNKLMNLPVKVPDAVDAEPEPEKALETTSPPINKP
ncbi:MAG: hypothetical protein PHP00_13360 [Thiotrichaceae bacterium]|nr:hypothetical protein [Thiotrichaceae bacterium]